MPFGFVRVRADTAEPRSESKSSKQVAAAKEAETCIQVAGQDASFNPSLTDYLPANEEKYQQ